MGNLLQYNNYVEHKLFMQKPIHVKYAGAKSQQQNMFFFKPVTIIIVKNAL